MTRLCFVVSAVLAVILLEPAQAAPATVEGIALSAQRGGFCTREYRPVCARSRGRLRTFPNACEARRDRARIVHPGRCRGGR